MLSWELRSSIKRCPGYWGSAYQAQGRSKESELSNTFLSKELVIFKMFFKSTAAAWTCATPAAVSFYFVKVECFGWQSASPKPPPLGVLVFLVGADL